MGLPAKECDMAAATPGAIWEFHAKVVEDRNVTIDFCLGLERGDVKYIAALMRDITQRLDCWQTFVIDNDQARPRSGWPPNIDHGDDLERFIEDQSPELGDAEIRYWLGKAAGEVDRPIGKSLHDQVIKQFRSLYTEIHEPELSNLWSWDELSADHQKAKDMAIRQYVAEIARKHCDQLDNITPEMLEAEVVVACELLEEGKQSGGEVDDGVPVYRGEGLYQVGNESIRLTGSQADVLETLVKLHAASMEQLQRSGCENPSAVLASIQKVHKLLAPFIKMPGGKNKGGYSTTIRNAAGK
jgi:hypothetical protein